MSHQVCEKNEEYAKVKRSAKVLFEYRGAVETGDVLRVYDDGKGVQMVSLIWLEGYKSRNEYLPLSTLLAVWDNEADELDFGCFTGRGILLPAGIQWQKDHPSVR
jgi:hypothetical protein